jgi:hypothetical protein
MSERTIGSDGLDEPVRPSYKFESERMQISREWHNITGCDIPDRIELLPIAEQRAALEFQRQKYRPSAPAIDEPIQPWDGHKEF